jgi:hypothetical protein
VKEIKRLVRQLLKLIEPSKDDYTLRVSDVVLIENLAKAINQHKCIQPVEVKVPAIFQWSIPAEVRNRILAHIERLRETQSGLCRVKNYIRKYKKPKALGLPATAGFSRKKKQVSKGLNGGDQQRDDVGSEKEVSRGRGSTRGSVHVGAGDIGIDRSSSIIDRSSVRSSSICKKSPLLRPSGDQKKKQPLIQANPAYVLLARQVVARLKKKGYSAVYRVTRKGAVVVQCETGFKLPAVEVFEVELPQPHVKYMSDVDAVSQLLINSVKAYLGKSLRRSRGLGVKTI